MFVADRPVSLLALGTPHRGDVLSAALRPWLPRLRQVAIAQQCREGKIEHYDEVPG
jgi:hypothetical protein